MPDDLKLNLCYLTCVLENLETWTHSYTQPRISELMIKLDVSNLSQVPFYSCHGNYSCIHPALLAYVSNAGEGDWNLCTYVIIMYDYQPYIKSVVSVYQKTQWPSSIHRYSYSRQ